MTDAPIVDTHVHFWNPTQLRYPWLDDVPKLNRPHLPEDYSRATDGVPVEQMVFVQCECDAEQYQGEADWVAALARQDPRIRAIVAWAPLERGAGAKEALQGLAANGLVKGIRRIIQFETDDDFCLQDDFVTGVQLLADFNLHFEICIKGNQQFANTLNLVRQCPDTRFILNHIGKPLIKERELEPWASHIHDLAELPNTWCKVSGLVNEADWDAWTLAELSPYVDHVLNCFGLSRVMFGGDWPVCTLASTYRRWFDTLSQAVGRHDEADQRRLFHDNAVEFYRLG